LPSLLCITLSHRIHPSTITWSDYACVSSSDFQFLISEAKSKKYRVLGIAHFLCERNKFCTAPHIHRSGKKYYFVHDRTGKNAIRFCHRLGVTPLAVKYRRPIIINSIMIHSDILNSDRWASVSLLFCSLLLPDRGVFELCRAILAATSSSYENRSWVTVVTLICL